MLTLIEGGFFAGGHNIIAKRISELTASGRRCYLIVPEQQTVNAEREMTDLLPPSAPLTFEVTNFTRFADTVFRTLGGLSKKAASSAQKALIMWRTLSELSPMLKSLRIGSEISAGNVQKMLGAIAEMQSLSITPADLLGAETKLNGSDEALIDKRLLAKVGDLSVVMSLYKKLLSEHFSDTSDVPEICAGKLASAPSEMLSDTEIFIDGFTSFTEPQYKLIRELIKRCDTTLSLNIPKAGADAFEFLELKETRTRIIREASLAGVDVSVKKIDGVTDTFNMLIPSITSVLWRSLGEADPDAVRDGGIRIYEAENPYEECDFIAADIKRRVMAGAKYSEFGIIARTLSAYSGILDVSFEKAGIPLFISEGADIGSFEVIRLIYSALAAVNGGFERRDVISYSKCSLSGVGSREADEFELYSEKWQISGRRFTDGVFWNMNPDGYTTHRREGHDEKLLLIDRARGAIISPLLALDGELSGAERVREYAAALINFLVSLDTEAKLAKKSAEVGAILGIGKSAEIGRIWKTVCDSLDAMCDVIGDVRVSRDTFTALLKITFSEIKIGKIPAFTEQVTAGDAEVARMHGKKYIYMIGVNAGIFPGVVDDDSFFTDKDKTALASAGLPIGADTGIRSARELYLFSRALSFAKNEAIVMYPAADTSFKPCPPSEAVSRIHEKSGGAICAVRLSELPIGERAYTADYALEHLSGAGDDASAIRGAARRAGLGERLTVTDAPINVTSLRLDKESLKLIYGDQVRTSSSRLEKYASCPMSYFCSYDLGLMAEERAEFNSMNIGNFIHAVLESFFAELRQRGQRISEITDGEKDALIKSASERFAAELFEGIPKTSARVENTVNVLRRSARPIIDGLCDEFSGCEYEPVFFELEIGKDKRGCPDSPTFTTLDGKEVYLVGKVDRVDTYRSEDDVFVRVIDYKTGSKDFSPKDIESGQNLQMFLYLKSIVESGDPEFKERIGASDGGRLIPAGVIYVKTGIADGAITKNDPDAALEAVKGSQKRLGMLLNDKDSIGAMNPKYIPIKFKVKDGEPEARSLNKLYTEEGWKKISETINSVVTDICNEMVSGNISALPESKKGKKSSPCVYCDFKAICRNSKHGKKDD